MNDDHPYYFVFDLETTSKLDPVRGPFHPYGQNKIYKIGYTTHAGLDAVNIETLKNKQREFKLGHFRYIVGLNLAFDMGYLLAEGRCGIPDLSTDVLFWDIGVFHYLMKGQGETYPSLNQLAEYWLGVSEQKSDDIESLIHKYGDVDLIPDGIIDPYLTQDTTLTHKIFLKQLEYLEASTTDETFLFVSEMVATKELIFATHRGIPVHIPKLKQKKQDLQVQAVQCIEFVASELKGASPSLSLTGVTTEPDLISSRTFAQDLLYRMEVTVPYKYQSGVFKSGTRAGQPKISNAKTKIHLGVGLPPTPDGSMPTDEKIISEFIEKRMAMGYASDLRTVLLSQILTFRKIQKASGTYCDNLLKYAKDSVIHPLYKQVATDTGRLSSSAPNIQNQM